MNRRTRQRRSRPPAAAAAFQPLTELPAAYDCTRLTLFEVDPTHVHAMWEVTPRDRERAAKHLGSEAADAKWVLQFFDVTGIEFNGSNAVHTFDIPIQLEAGNWYVELWSAGRSYIADIGLRSANGRFFAVSRSGVAHTPPAGASGRYQPRWMEVPQDPVAPSPGTEALRLGLRELPAEEKPQAQSPPAPVSSADAAPTQAAAPVFNEPLPPLPETPEWMLPGGVGISPVQPFDSHEPPNVGGSFDVGSFAMGGDGKPSIDLELYAEIIVYGRAQPGQTLQVNGRPVAVNADGTFRVQWALPRKE